MSVASIGGEVVQDMVQLILFLCVASIGGEVGQDMVQLEELKLSGNNLSATEAYLNKFITSLPV